MTRWSARELLELQWFMAMEHYGQFGIDIFTASGELKEHASLEREKLVRSELMKEGG